MLGVFPSKKYVHAKAIQFKLIYCTCWTPSQNTITITERPPCYKEMLEVVQASKNQDTSSPAAYNNNAVVGDGEGENNSLG